MFRKKDSQVTSLVEQTRRKAGVLSVTRSRAPRYLSKFFFTYFFIIWNSK